MELISKELLSEVLGIEVIKIDDGRYQYPNNDMSKIYYLINGTYGIYSSINIYELACKCKEWAVLENMCNDELNKGNHFYINDITTSFIGVSHVWQCYIGYRGTDKDGDWMDLCITFTDDIEPEAIFKACQWILDNKAN